VTAVNLFLAPLAVLVLATAPQAASAQTKSGGTDAPTAIIYDNGPITTGATSRSGAAAPAGMQWSEASWDFGTTTISNTLAGVGCQVIGVATNNRCADDFNVPVGQTWTINQVVYYVYQGGAVANPVIGANLRIFNGIPGGGGVVVFGDTTTNRLASSVDSGIFRIFNSGPPNNTAVGTTRRLWQVTVNVSPAAVLTAGNYWVDFQTDAGAGGNFTPPATITGTRGVPGWNARQSINGGVAWLESFDDGTPVTGPDIVQDFPFKLDGTVAFAPDGNAVPQRTMDFDGDGKSDYVVARSTGAAAQTTWYALNSGGGSLATNWGTGVGFAGGDAVTPADFDGDGKTDIAVWRTDPNLAYFYILRSSNGTLQSEQFGKALDDPSVVGDYDGDGKADVAVFRAGVGGGDPCGGSSVWYWRPSGTPATNFSYACWGLPGDRAYPGDYDGDGRQDYSVVRGEGGNAAIYQKFASGSTRGLTFGLFTDRFVSGDLDADRRSDIITVRTSGANIVWSFVQSGTNQVRSFVLGTSATDYVVPGDYDGDKRTDFGLWISGAGAASGNFYLLKTFTSPTQFKWGNSAANLTAPDYPVAAYQVH
jgi:hypothetical protein